MREIRARLSSKGLRWVHSLSCWSETMLFLKGIGSVNPAIEHRLYDRHRYQLWVAFATVLASERSHLVKALSGLNVPLLLRRAYPI